MKTTARNMFALKLAICGGTCAYAASNGAAYSCPTHPSIEKSGVTPLKALLVADSFPGTEVSVAGGLAYLQMVNSLFTMCRPCSDNECCLSANKFADNL